MILRLLFFLFSITLAPAAIAQQITVYSSGTVAVGDTRQLTAYVPLSPNTVTWTVNGIVGGNATVGTLTIAGALTVTYKAPPTVPSVNRVKVRATSTAFPGKYGEITITLTQLVPQLWSINPTATPAGPFTITLNGANYNANSVVNFGGVRLPTTFISATSLKATGTATASQAGTQVPVTVTNTGAGSVTSAAVRLSVTSAPAVTVSVSPLGANVNAASTQQFTATVSGSSNTSVTWSVNGTVGGNATVGTISATGLYTAPQTVPSPAQVTVQATSAASPSSKGSASVTITAQPVTTNVSAARFLEQAAFGPNSADLAHLQQVGVNAWLAEQISMPETPIADVPSKGNDVMQQQYLNRLSAAPDQLRQRLIHAFTQIIPISMRKNPYSDEMVPYLRIISRNALGNYRAMLGEISVSSQMGKYLDLANSIKPMPGSGANENYARELMQLFTIGVNRLNPDGSVVFDSQNRPVLNYTQADVQQVALALTGWMYINNAWEDFSGPMVPNETNHDTRQKTFLNCTLPANQTTTQDMNGVLDCVFNHPNIGPFIATRLIRAMVTSNPSPGYIQRVAAAFNDNGVGVRGDLSAVAKAILTDAEARNDVPTPNFGRLKDPMYQVVALVRALNGAIAPANYLPWGLTLSGQTPLSPPSVFSFYSPLYHIPKSPLFGPEFQIYSPTEAVERGNFMWDLITNPGMDVSIKLAPFNAVAGNTSQLIDAVDQTLLYGRMPPQMRQSLATAIDAQQDNNSRMQVALYLTALSGLYAVQY